MASSSRRQKLGDIADEDKLSRLPDSIVGHILSFLKTKEAVRTAVLSRRWRHTWTSVPCLNFWDSLCQIKKKKGPTMKSFVKFVNRVLILHSHPCIKRFCLHLSNSYSNSDIDSWICAAVTHNVEEIELSIPCDNYYKLPRILFSCASLMVLTLRNGINVDDIPDSAWLPSLKVLHFNHGSRLFDSSIEKLLSASPLLEELVIDKCVYVNAKTISVQSSSLKNFKFYCADQNLSLVIDAPKLEFLDIGDPNFYCDIEVKNLPSIIKATLGFISCSEFDPDDSFKNQVDHILRQIRNVKVLSLSSNILKSLFVAWNPKLISFPNLTRLDVRACGNEWSSLPAILKASSNLKVLMIQSCYSHDVPLEPFTKKQSVPKCVKSSLERLEFKVFQGSAGEMKMLEFVVKNANILKKIVISTCYPVSSKKEILLDKLSTFLRESNTYHIILL